MFGDLYQLVEGLCRVVVDKPNAVVYLYGVVGDPFLYVGWDPYQLVGCLCGWLGTFISCLGSSVWWLGPVSVGWGPLWVVGYLYKLVGHLCWVVCIYMGLV